MKKPKLYYTDAEMEKRQKSMYWYQRPKTNRVRGAAVKCVLAWAKTVKKFKPSEIPNLPLPKAQSACRSLAHNGAITKLCNGKAVGWQEHSEAVYKLNPERR